MTMPDHPSPSTVAAGPSPALDVVDHSDQRLVVHIPPQGSTSTRGLFAFAVFWTAFSLAMSGFFLFMGRGPAPKGVPSIALLVPLLFVAIGLGMLYAWARMRHTRVFVLVDPARVAVQRQFFRRKSETEIEVEPRTHAALVEAYSVNDVPVHVVAIQGGSQTLKFGVGLSPADKAWLVEQINALVCPVRAVDDAPFCSQCGAVLPVTDNLVPEEAACPACGHREVVRPVRLRETPIPEVRPERGDPVPEAISFRETASDELAFSVPLIPSSGIRQGIGWGGLFFWLVALVLVGPGLFRTILSIVAPGGPGAAGRGGFPIVFQLFELVHGVLFLVAPMVVVFGIARGRIHVRLSRERLAMRWGAGWLGIRRSTPLDAIDDVRLVRAESTRSGKRQTTMSSHGAAAVIVKGIPWIMTTFHPEPVALAAAGLVKTRLQDWDILVPHSPSPSAEAIASDEPPAWPPGDGMAE
jgi:predicted RNA-binding Zn-ribbon protein involved in translation (DUF1610 family)